MFSLFPSNRRQNRLTRRDALKAGSIGSFGAALPNGQPALARNQQSHSATAKRCIYIFLCGGPSQLDMWDLKPDAPDSIRGPFQPIDTNVPGLQIGDLLPMSSQQADKFSIVRSMMHTSTSLHASGSSPGSSFAVPDSHVGVPPNGV